MEFFKRAKEVRLRSQHNKYLVAAEDGVAVRQSRSGSSKGARWSVESVDNKPNVIRLKNCKSWNYLGATDDLFLLGMTGRRVVQSSPRLRLDPAVEWEPIKEGSYVKLRTRKGNFLRANGGIPPWNNSVTHDVPSRSATQDWIFWAVDVLEVEFESTEEGKGSTVGSHVEDQDQGGLSRTTSSGSTISKADYYKDCFEVGSSTASGSIRLSSSVDQVKQGGQDVLVDGSVKDQGSESLSRNSSFCSTTTSDYYKDSSENEAVSPAAPKSVRSVRHSSANNKLPNQSPKASPQRSEKPKRASPLGHLARDDSRHSASFNKLKSVLDGLDDLLDDDHDGDEHDDAKSDTDSEPVVESLHKPHALEVKMAKHTLEELKALHYETIVTCGKERKLEEAVNVLIADAKMSARGQAAEELANLQRQLKYIRQDYDSATQDVEDYTTFSTQRSETKAGLKKDAAKARELETLEVGLSDMLETARAKREELLKQLEEVENTIRDAEKAQAENATQIDELVSQIGQKSESLKEMEREEKSWQAKKFIAEKKLEKIEEDWIQMQSLFQDA